MSICHAAPLAAEDEHVLLEPLPGDYALSDTLASGFTLPMLFGIADLSPADLDNVVAAEVERLAGLLKSMGFLDARVEMTGTATPEDPLRLIPIPGPLYRLAAIQTEGLPADTDATLSSALDALVAQSLGVTASRDALDILRDGILLQLRQASFAEATVSSDEFVLDRRTGAADLTVTIAPGPKVIFGEVTFSGSYRFDHVDAQILVPFKPGDPYSISALNALQSALDATGEFSKIRIELMVNPETVGVVNLDVRLWDKGNIPNQLEELEDAGPRRLVLTILLMVLLESVRVTSLWSDRWLRRTLIAPVAFMIAGSAVEVADRVYGYLN